MLSHLLAAVLTLHPTASVDTTRTPPVDTVAVFTGLLSDLRLEHPRLRVVLNDDYAERCLPDGCETGDALPHYPRELVAILRRAGLVQDVCVRRPQHFTCGDPRWMYVALSPIHSRPHGSRLPEGVWVQVTQAVPCPGRCPRNVYGTWARLERSADGRWRVVDRIPSFVF